MLRSLVKFSIQECDLLRVVLETGPLSTCLHHGLKECDVRVECICARMPRVNENRRRNIQHQAMAIGVIADFSIFYFSGSHQGMLLRNSFPHKSSNASSFVVAYRRIGLGNENSIVCLQGISDCVLKNSQTRSAPSNEWIGTLPSRRARVPGQPWPPTSSTTEIVTAPFGAAR